MLSLKHPYVFNQRFDKAIEGKDKGTRQIILTKHWQKNNLYINTSYHQLHQEMFF